LFDRAHKWTRRHRSLALLVVVAFALLMLTLLVLAIVFGAEEARAKSAYAFERQQAREAHEQRIRAEQNFDRARRAVEFMTRIASGEMPKDPRLAPVRRRLLETSLAYYQEFLQDQRQQSARSEELSRAESD